jgi:demethylmenaquinone methyltransferase / 2-methoxy-6-polyprenyl-1,4-benzoquinol methylase
MYEKRSPLTIRSLFDSIAPRYDLANSLLAFQMHALWNQKLVKNVMQTKPQVVLDLCAGTGEIAHRLAKYSLKTKNFCPNITLLDFSPKMLEVASLRALQFPQDIQSKFTCQEGDAQKLTFTDGLFDAVSCAYGIRNIQSPSQCFSEVFRVLKPGGLFAIVELTRPKNPFIKAFHGLYLKTFVPIIGKWLASNKEAYNYLNRSIQSFLTPAEVIEIAKNSGFTKTEVVPLSFGIATMFLLKK